MIPLALLDVEADPLDPFVHIKLEHLARRGQALRREHRDHMERHAMAAQPADAGNRPLEGAAPGARPPVDVVQRLRAVDADADADLLGGEEFAPGIVDQRAVGLERMRHRQSRWLQPVDQPKRLSVEIDGQHHRFAGVPHNRNAIPDPTGGKDLGK